MLFKIIKVEAVEDKQYGHCTRICANAKPTGIKSVLPYSMITNKYGYDTYKLYVPNESYLIGSAQDAMNTGEFLDIDLNYFRQNEEWDWDDTIMDSNNSFYDLDFDKQNVAFLAKMLGQKLLFVLEYEGTQALAVWQTRLILSPWMEPDALRVELNGLNLDKVWENIVAGLAGVQVQQGSTLDEQIAKAQQREKLQKEIAKLEKLAWAEKQPKRKMTILQRIIQMQKEVNNLL